MNSRERIEAALRRESVDRLPIDFGGTRQSGISAFAYDRLRRRLDLPGLDPDQPFRVFDTYQMLAEIEAAVAERFGSDCVGLNRRQVAFGVANENWERWRPHPKRGETDLEVLVPGRFDPEPTETGGWVLRRDGEVIAEMPAGGYYFDRYQPYPGATHPDLDDWDPPRLSQADVDHYGRQAEALYEQTDKAIVMALGPPYELFNGIGQGGFEAWMVTFASEPDYVDALYAKLVDAWLENLQAVHAAVGERVSVMQIADDFGMQSGPFLSEAMFRERLLPAYRRGLAWVHAHTSWKVLLHSDGAIRPLLPAIIEMGVDALNPVQTSAPGMEAAGLNRDFGDRLAFWGGACDPQSTLSRGTPDQVAAEVRAHIDALAPGGGYVLAPVHNIQADVPAENIVALFDAALAHPLPDRQESSRQA
jgi:uroporphyrinogen decarboxylase